MLFSNDTGILGKRNSEFSNRSGTYDLPITSSDALPLSYRRLVGGKAIKLGSWDKHTARIRVSMSGICAMRGNVMEYI